MYVVNCLEEGTEKERGAEGRDGQEEKDGNTMVLVVSGLSS